MVLLEVILRQRVVCYLNGQLTEVIKKKVGLGSESRSHVATQCRLQSDSLAFWPEQVLETLANLALDCVELDPSLRPFMRDLPQQLKDLENYVDSRAQISPPQDVVQWLQSADLSQLKEAFAAAQRQDFLALTLPQAVFSLDICMSTTMASFVIPLRGLRKPGDEQEIGREAEDCYRYLGSYHCLSRRIFKLSWSKICEDTLVLSTLSDNNVVKVDGVKVERDSTHEVSVGSQITVYTQDGAEILTSRCKL